MVRLPGLVSSRLPFPGPLCGLARISRNPSHLANRLLTADSRIVLYATASVRDRKLNESGPEASS